MATQTLSKAVISPLADGIFERIGYDPTQGGHNVYQPAIMRSKAKYIAVTGGEQGGKSRVAASKFQVEWALDQGRRPERGDGVGDPHLYWLVAAAYGETQKEFEYILDDLYTLFPTAKIDKSKRIDPGYIELRHVSDLGKPDRKAALRIETKSATDITKLSKESPNGIILCEAAQMEFEVFERCRGRVAPMDGWLFIPGTMERGVGIWFSQMATAWAAGVDNKASFILPSYSNHYLYPGGIDDPKIQAAKIEQSDEWFLERIEGKPVPPRGLVFHEFDASKHVRDNVYNPALPVYIAEDPGYGSELAHAHALEIYQIVTDYTATGQSYEQVRGIDEIFEHGKITEDIINIAMRKPWWKSPKFLYSDPHYKDQHHSMSSVAEVWNRETGLVAGPNHRIPVMPGNERLKSFLGDDPVSKMPKIVFHSCQKGLLSNFGAAPNPLDGKIRPYRWKTDRQGAVYGQIPEEKNNDGTKATTYFLVGEFGYGYDKRNRKAIVTRHK